MFKVTALANTFAIIDIVLHPLFHLWITIAPRSYEWMMNLFVAGLQLKVTGFDSSLRHIVLGTIVEALAFGCLARQLPLFITNLQSNSSVRAVSSVG